MNAIGLYLKATEYFILEIELLAPLVWEGYGSIELVWTKQMDLPIELAWTQQTDLQKWKNIYSRVHNTIKAQQIIKYNNLIKEYFAQEQQQEDHINKKEKEKIQNYYINILFDKAFNRIEKEILLQIEEQYKKIKSKNMPNMMYSYVYSFLVQLDNAFNSNQNKQSILKKILCISTLEPQQRLTELLQQTTLMQEIDLQEWKNTYLRVHNTIKAQQIIKYNNLIKEYFAQEQQQKNHINKEEKEKIQNYYINILFDKFFNQIEKENLLQIEEQYKKIKSKNMPNMMYSYVYSFLVKLDNAFNNKNTQKFILTKFDEDIKKYKQTKDQRNKQTKDVPMEKIEEKTQWKEI